MLPQTDAPGAMKVAREILDQVAALNIPHRGSAAGAQVTVSIGVATAGCRPGMAGGQWIEHVDRELYLSKLGAGTESAGAIRG